MTYRITVGRHKFSLMVHCIVVLIELSVWVNCNYYIKFSWCLIFCRHVLTLFVFIKETIEIWPLLLQFSFSAWVFYHHCSALHFLWFFMLFSWPCSNHDTYLNDWTFLPYWACCTRGIEAGFWTVCSRPRAPVRRTSCIGSPYGRHVAILLVYLLSKMAATSVYAAVLTVVLRDWCFKLSMARSYSFECVVLREALFFVGCLLCRYSITRCCEMRSTGFQAYSAGMYLAGQYAYQRTLY